MDDQAIRVLFLCTGNSCRSIMAEALLNHFGTGRFVAHSAGSRPAGFVHPQTIACLNRNRIPVEHPQSKSWDDFAATDLDLVVTVCASAAGETCPVYPGAPLRAHWGVPDPALATGSDAAVAGVFQQTFEQLQRHIRAFVRATQGLRAGDRDGLRRVVMALGPPT